MGMLIHLVEHYRGPDISNLVRELTRVLDGATDVHCKEIKHRPMTEKQERVSMGV